jgi:hypothetical protein
VSKRALFDSTNEYYFGSNPDINQWTKGNKKHNVNAMK